MLFLCKLNELWSLRQQPVLFHPKVCMKSRKDIWEKLIGIYEDTETVFQELRNNNNKSEMGALAVCFKGHSISMNIPPSHLKHDFLGVTGKEMLGVAKTKLLSAWKILVKSRYFVFKNLKYNKICLAIHLSTPKQSTRRKTDFCQNWKWIWILNHLFSFSKIYFHSLFELSIASTPSEIQAFLL